MAVTRSSAAERHARTPVVSVGDAASGRTTERILLLAVTLIACAVVLFTYLAKNRIASEDRAVTIQLSRVTSAEQLLPALAGIYQTPRERQVAAGRIFDRLVASGGKLPNVGALGLIRISAQEARGLPSFAGRTVRVSDGTLALLTPGQVAEIKPSLAVRDKQSWRNQVFVSALLWLAAFWAVHLFWTYFARFTGNQMLVPAALLLTSMGFATMISLRDPLRDAFIAGSFAQSTAAAVVLMGICALLDFSRIAGRLSYLPLLAAIAISIALILFGTGPGTSDAKVNLLGMQPVEAIKILLIFFLAGYFASRWEFLRVLREERPGLERISAVVPIPRFEYLVPVLAAVGLTLVFFFLQKDLGPAMVWSFVFLAIYSVARGRILLASVGLGLLSLGLAAGYLMCIPRTVYDRVQMWLSPWDNTVRGGEQVVHALWGFASGGAWGTGPGLGQPAIMPAAHTDLILAAIGEEWGLPGVLVVYFVYACLLWTGLRIARLARTDYEFFLALGCTLLLGFEILLISGGVLDLIPLSGVVTPFLSYGGTAMLANFVLLGILLSLSARGVRREEALTRTAPFRSGVKRLAQAFAVLLLALVGKAVFLTTFSADAIAGAGALTLQADGQRRYQYNPRLTQIARSIPRGTVYDASGLPLATSDAALLAKVQDRFAALKLPTEWPQGEERYYPLGAYAIHLLGDARTQANWGASNSSLVERDAMARLQGYDDRARAVEVKAASGKPSTWTVRHDYRELIPLLRHRWEPGHQDVRKVLDRDRDVRLTIHAPFQVRVSRILESGLKRLKRNKGSVVVMDAESGATLASVSYPWPAKLPPQVGADGATDELLDRARYGLYPPGSTFKLVTAMAALRVDPLSASLNYECKALDGGRIGNFVKGWGRPIRDDIADQIPHGQVGMERGIAVSCNAYFAQLGTYKVGAEALRETARLFGISTAVPDSAAQLRKAIPQASYGQGQVVVSPFQMARVAASVAAGGLAPYGMWVRGEGNNRVETATRILPAAQASQIASYMREAVTSGTGRSVLGVAPAIAGKTGTAELADGPSHAWFAGFAPFGSTAKGRKLAFAVLVENGQYGGAAAAPIAGEVMAVAAELGLFGEVRKP